MEDHPQEPWFGDYPWNRRGIRGDSRSNVGGCLAVIVVLILMLLPMIVSSVDDDLLAALRADPWSVVKSGDLGPLLVPAGLLAIPLLLLVITVVWAASHRAKYGRGELQFSSFPYFLGEPLEGRLRLRAPGGGFDRLTLVLRSVEERAEATTTGGRRSNTINVYQVWSQTRVLERAGLPSGRDIELPVRFSPPLEGLETRLSGLPPRYWEVAAHGEAPGVDYKGHFLVPVYQRPGHVRP
jgi:hypothetical protein